MSVTFAFTETLWEQLSGALDDPREVAGIIATRITDGPAGPTILARAVSWAPVGAYLGRQPDGLQLRSDGWVPAVRAVLRDRGTPVFVHTHPRGQAKFSRYDDAVDDLMLDALRRMGGDGSYGSLVLAGMRNEPAVAGRLYLGDTATRAEKFRITGNRLRLLLSRAAVGADSDTFDRQIRVFGEVGQDILNALNAAVIGAGGTGSATAEQLARLGVGAITIVDDDIVTAATPTRGYGITTADIGRTKAEVLTEHLLKAGLSPAITPVVAPIQEPAARAAIANADIVFSCVDGHGARLVLNRWAYAHLAPVVDLAVLDHGRFGHCDGHQRPRHMAVPGRSMPALPRAARLNSRIRRDAPSYGA
jgi:ThiF family